MKNEDKLPPINTSVLNESKLTVVPSAVPVSQLIMSVSAEYNERLMVLNLIDQLNYLCRGVQRHRGFSMGLLAGNQSFLDRFNALQKQINRRIQLISALSSSNDSSLSEGDLERIHFAWNTIRDNWQDDSVLENFEYHSHFVDQLLMMMSTLLERIRIPLAVKIQSLVSLDEHTFEPDEQSIYQTLLVFAQAKLPNFIEILGKVRALSVNAATTSYCEPDNKQKLVYLLQCMSNDRPILFNITSRLQASLIGQLPSLLTIKTYEYKLDFLISEINKEIILSSKISIKEEDVFTLVTDIIDIYWRVVDDSLGLLTLWQRQDLEQWLVEN